MASTQEYITHAAQRKWLAPLRGYWGSGRLSAALALMRPMGKATDKPLIDHAKSRAKEVFAACGGTTNAMDEAEKESQRWDVVSSVEQEGMQVVEPPKPLVRKNSEQSLITMELELRDEVEMITTTSPNELLSSLSCEIITEDIIISIIAHCDNRFNHFVEHMNNTRAKLASQCDAGPWPPIMYRGISKWRQVLEDALKIAGGDTLEAELVQAVMNVEGHLRIKVEEAAFVQVEKHNPNGALDAWELEERLINEDLANVVNHIADLTVRFGVSALVSASEASISPVICCFVRGVPKYGWYGVYPT